MTIKTFTGIWNLTAQKFVAKNTFEMGAALAYYAVFSLSPLVLLAITIAGFFFGEQAAQGRVAEELHTAVGPTVADAIQQLLNNARNSAGRTSASIIGGVLLLIAASGVFVQLQTSLNTIWEVPTQSSGGPWGFVRTRLLSFALVVVVGMLLLGSLVVSTTLSALGSYLVPSQPSYYELLNQAISFVILSVLFALLFRLLPECHVAWGDVWIGAAVTSLLFIFGKYLIGLYLSTASGASAYGAAGSLVIILLWVYYASQILLFGAQFTQVIANQRRPAVPLVQSSH
jgi:membrane protein